MFVYGGSSFDKNNDVLNDLWELSCDSELNGDIAFKWSIVDKQPHGHWPFLLAQIAALQADVAKTAMMVWPIRGVSIPEAQETYWIFNSTSRTWHSFVVDDGITPKENEMYHIAVFHEGLENIVEIVNQQAYAFSMSETQWLNINSTLDCSGEEKGILVTAAYVDSLLLVFASSPPDEFPDKPKVWKLQHESFRQFAWKLNRYNPVPPVSPLYGTWSNVGDSIILIPRLAPNLEKLMSEIWSAVRAIVNGADVSSADSLYPYYLQATARFILITSFVQILEMSPVRLSQTKDVTQGTQVVWQLDLLTLAWFPYSTSHSTSETSRFYSIGTNWGDNAVVTFGSSCTDDNIVQTIPILCSDVWVYFPDNRIWINVTITSASNPGFRLLPSITKYGESSFLLFGGAIVNVTEKGLDKFPYYRDLKSGKSPFHRDNFTAVLDLMSPMNDLWLLTLTDCNSTSCFDDGIVGVWKELRSKNSSRHTVPSNKMGHSSQLIDRKLFVFGGVSVDSEGGKRYVLYHNKIWYYDFNLCNWFTANGKGLEQFVGSSLVVYRRGMFNTCAIGKRVIAAIPVYAGEQENSIIALRYFSYFADTGQWIDHRVDFPFQDEGLFCWRNRIVITTRVSVRHVTNLKRGHAKVFVSELQQGCPAGQHSLNWSVQICAPCAQGHFSSAGATLCLPCPGRLSTDGLGATSVSNCSCDPSYCKHGHCLVVTSRALLAAECKCQFGYTGERCEFPTLFIGLFSGVAALLVVIVLTLFLRKLVNYRKAKRKKEFEMEDMDRVWTISSSEVALLQTVDASPSGSFGDVFI